MDLSGYRRSTADHTATPARLATRLTWGRSVWPTLRITRDTVWVREVGGSNPPAPTVDHTATSYARSVWSVEPVFSLISPIRRSHGSSSPSKKKPGTDYRNLFLWLSERL